MKKLIMIVTFAFGLTAVGGNYISPVKAQTVTKVKTKKPWSKRKKNAVIGGASGAVVGAAVSHKKGKGAVIGGAVGAAGGYLYGRHKDKKAGRIRS
jgi:uncharacterized protein YcfJ